MKWLIAALLLISSSALAQDGTLGGIGSGQTIGGIGGGMGAATGTVGAAPSPPTCSNELDFSQACNSQYVGIM